MNCLTNLLTGWYILTHLTNCWSSTSARLRLITLDDRWYMSNQNVHSITCVGPVYVTQTTTAVTIWHNIYYSIKISKAKQWIIGFQNKIGVFIITLWVLRQPHVRCLISTWLVWGIVGHHHLGEACYRKWRHRKWPHRQSRDRKWRDQKWC